MTQETFVELLQQLKEGKIDKLTVEQPDFLEFRKAWLSFCDRTSFVGEAGLQGTISYRYEPSEKEA
ncbi:hypothetical protein [Tetragenococcus halophilus]|uniref:hypothetical protein n=1 Tax=Tetragenococcus halophilus TaxID=51669 RepID=UPI001B6697A3|nr:hypothetical protein [Tetragenococcus halophilus]GFK22411.1 hypothetical protein WJ7_18740 [Tetragenococcus halophilus]